MSTLFAASRLVRLPLLLLVVGLLACRVDDPTSSNPVAVAANGEVLPTSYGPCPDPVLYCSAVHPGSEASAYCAFDACFEMTVSDELRMVAADEQGLFPRTFFVWTDRPLTAADCVLTKSGKKIRVELPAGATRCRADLSSGEYVYFEHFASNPTSGCLGWLECRLPVAATAASE